MPPSIKSFGPNELRQVSPTQNPLKSKTHIFWGPHPPTTLLASSLQKFFSQLFFPSPLLTMMCPQAQQPDTLLFAFLGFIPYSNTALSIPCTVIVGPKKWENVSGNPGPPPWESYIGGGTRWIWASGSAGPVQILRAGCNRVDLILKLVPYSRKYNQA